MHNDGSGIIRVFLNDRRDIVRDENTGVIRLSSDSVSVSQSVRLLSTKRLNANLNPIETWEGVKAP